MMTNAEREELEGLVARASELESEIEHLRQQNVELESLEARQNAQRLAAAVEREHAEQQRNADRDREDPRLRRAAIEAATKQRDAQELSHWHNGLLILAAGLVSALVAGTANSPAIGVGSFALFAIGLIYLYVAETRARTRRQKGDDQ